MYDIKRSNGMNSIHDNEVNNIAEYNLLSDILNTSRRVKNINNHYSIIIHGCMNTQKGRAKIVFPYPIRYRM